MTATVEGRLRTTDESELKQRVHRRLVAEGVDVEVMPSNPAVRRRLGELLRDEQPLLGAARFDQLLQELAYEVSGLGPLEPLLADPAVTEVMINGPGRAYVERHGVLEPVVLGLDAASILQLVERVVAPLGLRLDRASPMVDARLPDGSRLHAVIPPLAVDGPCVTIRRFGSRAIPIEQFGLDRSAAAFLRRTIVAGWNVLVAGATSAGKTTLLNALSAAIPHHDRIVTIEETAELRLAQSHVVRLEARPANAEGSLSTIHANSAVDALARLETLVLLADAGLPLAAVRAQIVASVDAVVFVARRAAGARRIEEIAEVAPGESPSVRPLYRWTGAVLAPVAAPRRPSRRPDASLLVDGGCRC
jgi:pilus assembly protein CpaF